VKGSGIRDQALKEKRIMLDTRGEAMGAKPQARLETAGGKRYPLIEDRLARLRFEHRYRFLRRVDTAQDARIMLDGEPVLLFCSNNYLGLANHPALQAAAREAVDRFGCGSGASRLISGNMHLHEELEERLARFKRYPACILFGSGYAANVGVLSSLMEAGDIIFSDALNHASIIDGCRLSRADVRIYRHRDTEHLESLMKEAQGYRKRLIVTDTLFSMGGDLAPLPDLVTLARRYDSMLMLDEAHAVGVMGSKGRGVAEHYDLDDAADISVGTLGKALGSFGAFAVCRPAIREFLVNHARSLIYSTSLPPPVLAAAAKALEVLEAEPARRERLAENANHLAKGIRALGFSVPEPVTPIQSVVMGEEARAMSLCERLLLRGVYAQGIRPPTVPPESSRIRFSLMATHSRADIVEALNALSSSLATPDTGPAEPAPGAGVG
jgi:8-amino-7-oxononanoate synthase